MGKPDYLKGDSGSDDLHDYKYQFFFKHAPLGILYLDDHGVVTGCNERFAEIMGAPVGKFTGLKMLDLPDENVRRVTRQVLAGEPSTYRGAYTSVFSGKTIHLSVYASPLFDDHNRLVGGMAMFEDVSEQYAAEMRLLEERKRFANILEGSNVGTWEWNVQTGEVIFNERWAGIAGYTLEELLPVSIRTWESIVHPDDLSRSTELLEKHFNGQLDYYECECRMRHKQGHNVWVLDRGRVSSWSEDGKPLLMYGSHVDISDRKQWEEEVSKKTDMLEKFFDVNLDLLCIADNDGRFIKANKAWERVLGYPEKELLEKPYMDFVHPDDVQKTRDAMAQLMSQKEVMNFVNRYRTKSGDYRHIEWRSKPSGNLVYAAARDITGRLKVEEELKEAKETAERNEAMFKAIFDTSPAGIAIYNEDGVTFYLNDAIAKIDGYPVKEELGTHFAARIHPDDLDMVMQHVSDIFSGKTKRIAREVRFIHKEGHTVWVMAETMLFPYEFSGKKAVISALQDITGIKEAEKELQELNATKDKFMSIISHDLRSPFNAILGYSELLLDQHDIIDGAARGKLIQNLFNVAGNTLKLLDNLLTWARSQSGKLEMAAAIINMKFMVSDLFVFFEAAATNKQIDLCNDIHESIFVTADKFMLDTILRNLVTNAIKYSHAGGVITLGAKPVNGWVEFSVRDTGVGMDEPTRLSLFNLGETRVRPGTNNEQGTGLGLILCKEFVEKHGGQIWVHSDPGKGSDFCFTLPAG